MRISDWSSDVCSSDLRDRVVDVVGLEADEAEKVEGVRVLRIPFEHPAVKLLGVGQPSLSVKLDAALQRLLGRHLRPMRRVDRRLLGLGGETAFVSLAAARLACWFRAGQPDERRVGEEVVRRGRYRGLSVE